MTAPDGRAVENAVGVALTLGGKHYEVVVNPDGAEVNTANGLTHTRISIQERPR